MWKSHNIFPILSQSHLGLMNQPSVKSFSEMKLAHYSYFSPPIKLNSIQLTLDSTVHTTCPQQQPVMVWQIITKESKLQNRFGKVESDLGFGKVKNQPTLSKPFCLNEENQLIKYGYAWLCIHLVWFKDRTGGKGHSNLQVVLKHSGLQAEEWDNWHLSQSMMLTSVWNWALISLSVPFWAQISPPSNMPGRIVGWFGLEL